MKAKTLSLRQGICVYDSRTRLSLNSVQHSAANDDAQHGGPGREPAGSPKVYGGDNDEAFKQRDERKADVMDIAAKPVVALRKQRHARLQAAKEHIQAQPEQPKENSALCSIQLVHVGENRPDQEHDHADQHDEVIAKQALPGAGCRVREQGRRPERKTEDRGGGVQGNQDGMQQICPATNTACLR